MPSTDCKAGNKKFIHFETVPSQLTEKLGGFMWNLPFQCRDKGISSPQTNSTARHCTQSQPVSLFELHPRPGECPGTGGAPCPAVLAGLGAVLSLLPHTPSSWVPPARGIGATHNIYSRYAHQRTNINKKCLVCLRRPNVIVHFNE